MADLYIMWGTKRIKTPSWILKPAVLPYYLHAVTNIPKHRQLIHLHPDVETPVDLSEYSSWPSGVPVYLKEIEQTDSDVDDTYHIVDENFVDTETAPVVRLLVARYLESVTDVVEDLSSSSSSSSSDIEIIDEIPSKVEQTQEANFEENDIQEVLHRETQVGTDDFLHTDLTVSFRKTWAALLGINNNDATLDLSSLRGKQAEAFRREEKRNNVGVTPKADSSEVLSELRDLRYSMSKVEQKQRQVQDLFVCIFMILYLVGACMMLSTTLYHSSLKSLEMSLKSTKMISNPLTGCPVNSAVLAPDAGDSEQNFLKTADSGHGSTGAHEASSIVGSEEEKEAQNYRNIEGGKNEDKGGPVDGSEKTNSQVTFFTKNILPMKELFQYLKTNVKVMTKGAAVIMEKISLSI